MTDRLVQGPLDGSYLVPVLGSLRRHDGLTVKRLTTVPGAQALLRLPVIQNHAVQTGLKPAEAAVEVIVQQVAALESPTDRIIADAVLRLGLYVERYRAHPLSRRALYQLTAGGLGDRRTALLENWSELHAALDERPPAGQLAGEHTLRARLEREVFERLGAALVNPEAATTSARSNRPCRHREPRPSLPPRPEQSSWSAAPQWTTPGGSARCRPRDVPRSPWNSPAPLAARASARPSRLPTSISTWP
jgi:hypothetical protein